MVPAHLPSDWDAIGVGLINHLWQSTVFAAVAGASTLLLRKNSATVRYRLWLAASLKFLLPFSLLVGIGAHMSWYASPRFAQSKFPLVMREIGHPFAAATIAVLPFPAPPPTPAARVPVLVVFAAIWAIGTAFVLLVWWLRWFHIVRILRTARLIERKGISPIKILTSPAGLEPGVFGILRPVLILPEGAALNLNDSQLDAIVDHEMCHVRGRDNLVALLHTIVEAAFWFHPLVWWIGERLVDERERACDEAVLKSGYEPAEYAAGILKVCECYVKAPACVAGVSGINLKKRIEAIMDYRGTTKLNLGKKLVLAAAGAGILMCPLFDGIMHAAEVRSASFSAIPSPVFEVTSKVMAAVSQQNPVRPAVQEPNLRQRWGDKFQIVSEERAAFSRLQNPAQPAVQEPSALRQWPEDVQSIITDAERTAYSRLGTDAERLKFIEQFWLQRDPTPGTPENEFKDEYYRRFTYANEHFTGLPGVPGSKTDRGKMYILNGQPDEIQSHPSGGAYYRTPEEGGGVTKTFPFERWRYRHIDGKGDNITYEFVDQQMKGDYRLEYDPSVNAPPFQGSIRLSF